MQSATKPAPWNCRRALLLCSYLVLCGTVKAENQALSTKSNLPIKVVNPRKLPGNDISAVRTPLGIPNDYKPWMTRLDGQKLLIVAFSYGGVPSNKLPKGTPYLERAIFWRSDDGGKTWGSREEHANVHGREFSLNRLSDGTLLMPCHFLSQDAANKAGHTYSKLFRSTDDGRTWTETRLGPDGFPAKAQTASDWTVFELPDPNRKGKMLAMFGVSMQHGRASAPSHVYLWRSRNSGETWDKSLKVDTAGWIDVDGFFSQSTTHRTKSGKLLHPVRVDRTGPHWKLPAQKGLNVEAGDQGDRMMLWESTDNGLHWKKHDKHGRFGTYGEMYPRFLTLADHRLLLTFTVRSNSTDGFPLGLRAIISNDDGQTWDFRRDRIIIDAQNHGASGGGFGNTVQTPDGNLVSVYSYRGKNGETHIEACRWTLPARATSKSSETISMFDGKSLSGWKAVPAKTASDWTVKNGAIVGRGSANRLSYLVWKSTDLVDFELRFRYRLLTKGNTGVEIRAQPDVTGKRPFQGYHADLGHVGIGRNILGAWDFHFARRKEHPCPRGTRLVIDADEKARTTKIRGALTIDDVRKRDWNDVRIVARGNRFQFFINGKLASEFTDNAKRGRLEQGAIGLQLHDKGMHVEFKDLRLKKLPTSKTGTTTQKTEN